MGDGRFRRTVATDRFDADAAATGSRSTPRRPSPRPARRRHSSARPSCRGGDRLDLGAAHLLARTGRVLDSFVRRSTTPCKTSGKDRCPDGARSGRPGRSRPSLPPEAKQDQQPQSLGGPGPRANSGAERIASWGPLVCKHQRWKQQPAAARRRRLRTCAIAQTVGPASSGWDDSKEARPRRRRSFVGECTRPTPASRSPIRTPPPSPKRSCGSGLCES